MMTFLSYHYIFLYLDWILKTLILPQD